MLLSLAEIEKAARAFMVSHGYENMAERAARDCSWLEGVSYPGLKILKEAISDPLHTAKLDKDDLGLDLQNVSCVFLADRIAELYAQNGRMFLRNVRHGLYLLPLSVHNNFGIGCPVDPGFALGGERTKNPYLQKIELAHSNGVTVDAEIWSAFA